ncbi:MAG: sodium:proton antiporter [Candidatus Omnitrophica bacterium]|nr:sodium:proton antiporter [Candidatus Omnitrophota bacterium]
MHETQLLQLASILVLGIGAQWLAWHFRLPSILLLLIAGFAAGPATGFLDPDHLFGDLLLPIVSCSVGIILFEGGLTLRYSELKEIGPVVRNLISIGALATWLAGGIFAYLLLGLEFNISLLLGAILVVSGPTVVGPLLLHVRPNQRLSSTLKWEGILIDPVGAVLAVLLFEIILKNLWDSAVSIVLLGVIQTIASGLLIGVLFSKSLHFLIQKYWIPDSLQNPISLMMVIAAFVASNMLHEESGLLAVTVMGIVLANQKSISIRSIVHFKEDLRILLLSSLFIILVARLRWEYISAINAKTLLFVAALIFVVRPIAVFVSTIGSNFSIREKAFLAWMAPRGIVAASVSSVFSLRLIQEGFPQAEQLIVVTFLVIVCTVLIYGFTARPAARWLKAAEPGQDGFLFIGAHDWSRELAKRIYQEGCHVLLVDTDRSNIKAARLEGLPTYHGNLFSDFLVLSGIGKVLALTSNDEINAMACNHFSDVFDRSSVFQLKPRDPKLQEENIAIHFHGRHLFGKHVTYPSIVHRIMGGFIIKKTKITQEFSYDKFKKYYQENVIPFFVIDENKKIRICDAEKDIIPQAGESIIALVPNVDK